MAGEAYRVDGIEYTVDGTGNDSEFILHASLTFVSSAAGNSEAIGPLTMVCDFPLPVCPYLLTLAVSPGMTG